MLKMSRSLVVSILLMAASPLAAQAPASAPAPGTLHVALTGESTFNGPVPVTCRKDDFQPEVTQIEGRSKEIFVRFSLIEARRGTLPIVLDGLTPPSPAYVRFDVLMIGNQPYSIPAGEVTLQDDAGRQGAISARRFTKNGSSGGDVALTLDGRWNCR